MYFSQDFSNMIAIFSFIFSGASIIVTVLSMAMEKSLINQQQYIWLKMDITEKSLKANSNKYKKRVKKIRNGISNICGLDAGLVEMIKPSKIPNGLRMECYLYVTDVQNKQNEYETLFNEAKQNGTLAQYIYESWRLSVVPNIANLKVEQIKSENAPKTLIVSKSGESGQMTDPIPQTDDN